MRLAARWCAAGGAPNRVTAQQERRASVRRDGAEEQQVDLLHKEDKAALLRLLCRRLERRGLVAGRIERILSARVPIIKFVERQSGTRPPLRPNVCASQPDPPARML